MFQFTLLKCVYRRLLFFIAAPYKQHLCTSDFHSVNRSKTVVGAFQCCHELPRLSTLQSNCPSRYAVPRHMNRILVMIRLLLDSIAFFIIAHLVRQVDRKIPDVPKIRFSMKIQLRPTIPLNGLDVLCPLLDCQFCLQNIHVPCPANGHCFWLLPPERIRKYNKFPASGAGSGEKTM